MRIIATCMASNEADIIEAFVRHNLHFLDAIVVLDHCSVDGTAQVLAQLAAEGLPLVALADRDRAFRQGQRQSQLARRYMAELGADFCFALDADEFIKCDSRTGLEQSLRRIPDSAFGLVHWQNYLPGPELGSDPNPLLRITSREAQRARPERKVILTRRFLEAETWQVAIGNHFAVRVVDGAGTVGDHEEVEDVWLAHFPVRSVAQIERKVILGWLAHRLSDPGRVVRSTAPGVPSPAWHWGELFRELMAGKVFDPASLHQLAIRFYAEEAPAGEARRELILDPLPVRFGLRYTTSVELSPLVAVSRWADTLVSDLLQARSAPGAANP